MAARDGFGRCLHLDVDDDDLAQAISAFGAVLG